MRVIRGNRVQTIDTCIQTTINAERREQTLNALNTTARRTEDICSWSEAVKLHVCAWPSTAVREMQESTQSKHLALGSTIEVRANDDDRTHMILVRTGANGTSRAQQRKRMVQLIDTYSVDTVVSKTCSKGRVRSVVSEKQLFLSSRTPSWSET
jgi:hypothetical protein